MEAKVMIFKVLITILKNYSTKLRILKEEPILNQTPKYLQFSYIAICNAKRFMKSTL